MGGMTLCTLTGGVALQFNKGMSAGDEAGFSIVVELLG